MKRQTARLRSNSAKTGSRDRRGCRARAEARQTSCAGRGHGERSAHQRRARRSCAENANPSEQRSHASRGTDTAKDQGTRTPPAGPKGHQGAEKERGRRQPRADTRRTQEARSSHFENNMITIKRDVKKVVHASTRAPCHMNHATMPRMPGPPQHAHIPPSRWRTRSPPPRWPERTTTTTKVATPASTF